MIAYRVYIGEQLGGSGLVTWMQRGELIVANGRQMVSLAHGVIVPSDGWHADPGAAKAAAAKAIQDIAVKLVEQAAGFMREAEVGHVVA